VVGAAVSFGSIQNVELRRLFTIEEIEAIRDKQGRSTAPTSHPVSSNRLGQRTAALNVPRIGIEFAPDSPLEGAGFELRVPPAEKRRSDTHHSITIG